ncbi:MAG: acetyl-CoA decarbonylase/synthase complex subunit delta, partial [Candidatus Omnitrophica bacterium]|nr:acetyl-CoA decarbonylase/synthase complex subunit delta [Candidatus Omnitrophota bacterium]
LLNFYGQDTLSDPLAWADKCINEYKAELLCLKLQGTHPDSGNKTASHAAKLVSTLLSKIKVPLIIMGSGDDAKDNLILPACSEAAKQKRCLIGSVVQDNYKTLVASVLADGHSIIAESPIDINIAKQLNILISDMGLSLERIVMNPTIGALGYGLEYAYSIMERARLAALSGDKTLAMPFICFVGQEAWKAKEAKTSGEQGIIWEAITATSLIQSGADLLIMRHPQAAEKVNNYIGRLFKK